MFEEINRNRRSFLTTTVQTIAATQLGRLGCTKQHATPTTAELPIEGELPSLVGAIAWLNSQPLTVDGLRGKVVIINFWTYTCINWLRQLPYVRAWVEKYKDQGLTVIGVHTPEFEFEKNIDNVRRADRVPIPRPRPASRHGAGRARNVRAVSRARRRAAGSRGSWT